LSPPKRLPSPRYKVASERAHTATKPTGQQERNFPSPFDLQEIVKMVEELKGMMVALEERTKAVGAAEELKKMHEEGVAHVKKFTESFERIKQGPRGEPGMRAPEVDVHAVAREAAALVPKPKDGVTPVVDERRIAKRAAKYIAVPEGKPGKDADEKLV